MKTKKTQFTVSFAAGIAGRNPFSIAWRQSAVSLCVLIAVLAGWRVTAQDATVTVRKTAAEANPTLCLASFQGPSEIQVKLLETLRRCDWFTVVQEPARAAYVLQAVYESGAKPALKMQVNAGPQPVTSFRVEAAPGGADRVIYRAVDTLIAALFRNPGPCDSRLAFTVSNGRQREVFSCNFDGTDFRQVTYNGSISTEPSWGPGGRSLVYTMYNGSRTNIVLVDMAQGRQRRLTAFPGLNSGAAIAPDGQRLSLTLSKDNRVDLYTLALGGRDAVQLTRDVAVESSPCWSPDGRTICYVSDREGRPRLYLISAAGGSSRRLVTDSAECVSPDWSPVSNQICFSTREDGRYVLGVTEADGSGQRRLINPGPGDWEAPAWAPDGRHVVCTRTLGRQKQLYMVDMIHGTALPVTKPASVSLPSWSAALK